MIENKVGEPPEVATPRWERYGLWGILAVAAVLYCWGIGDRQLQPYYAAAVRSMTENWHAFLYAGFDPSGVLSIDKTPLAFWVQGIGVWIVGYHWWAIALVQAVEGVASVFVLHRVVRRWAGERPALFAALVLAVSPITTAIDRSNQADCLMVLLLLLGAYCVTRAVERSVADGGGTAWLVWAGVFVGLAFFAKMLAAWVVLPALGLGYLAAPVSWPKKVVRLLLAGVVAAAVSLAWPVLVSLTPAADRPFVGSTTSNSIWDLLFNYNGFGRVSGGDIGSLGALTSSYGVQFSGATGLTRLFGPANAGQIGWLLPLAVASVIGAAIVWLRTRTGTPQQRAGWLLWGGWLIVAGLVFSFAGGIFHRYYTVELAPAVAATVAVGLSAMWGWYRQGRRVGLLLPAAVLLTVGYAWVVLDDSAGWQPWLRWTVVIVGVVAAVALLRIRSRTVVLIAVAAMLAGPIAYSVDTMFHPQTVITAADPAAGPTADDVLATAESALGSSAAAQDYLQFMSQAGTLSPAQQEVIDYVNAHAGGARVPLAVEFGSWGADPYLINSSVRAVALGGYVGLDPAPTTGQLAEWASQGQLGYVLLPSILLEADKARPGTPSASQGARLAIAALVDRVRWTATHCHPIAPVTIGPDAAGAGVLFRCMS